MNRDEFGVAVLVEIHEISREIDSAGRDSAVFRRPREAASVIAEQAAGLAVSVRDVELQAPVPVDIDKRQPAALENPAGPSGASSSRRRYASPSAAVTSTKPSPPPASRARGAPVCAQAAPAARQQASASPGSTARPERLVSRPSSSIRGAAANPPSLRIARPAGPRHDTAWGRTVRIVRYRGRNPSVQRTPADRWALGFVIYECPSNGEVI